MKGLCQHIFQSKTGEHRKLEQKQNIYFFLFRLGYEPERDLKNIDLHQSFDNSVNSKDFEKSQSERKKKEKIENAKNSQENDFEQENQNDSEKEENMNESEKSQMAVSAKCPDCGSGRIVEAIDIVTYLEKTDKTGEMSEENLEALKEADLYCKQCNFVFDVEEMNDG